MTTPQRRDRPPSAGPTPSPGDPCPRIIAEGVEHKAALGLLADAGVAYVQGFATGRPRQLPRETRVREIPITGGASR